MRNDRKWKRCAHSSNLSSKFCVAWRAPMLPRSIRGVHGYRRETDCRDIRAEALKAVDQDLVKVGA
jgi:hypothetical protein